MIADCNVFKLSDVEKLVGSETDSTIRSRKSREQKALQCNTDIEKEKEIDKDLEKEGEKEMDRVQNLHPTKSYGTFNNVVLTDEEYELLKYKLGIKLEAMIDKLSMYMTSTGKIYQSHYATLLYWYQKDKAEEEKLSPGRRVFTLDDYQDMEI